MDELDVSAKIPHPFQKMLQQSEMFTEIYLPMSSAQVLKPAGYTGLHAFHKYWGKKPLEPLSFLIEHLSPKGGVVVDPFLGGGLLTRVCRSLNRRFIGIDINPVATELGRLFVDLPSSDDYNDALKTLEKDVRPKIDSTYSLSDGSTGSHYLWTGSQLESVWTTGKGRSRVERSVEEYDLRRSQEYASYSPTHLREIKAFSNSRINATPSLSLRDIFKGRALANIDCILKHILAVEDARLRRALLLTLTAASGQMSNFVFAISKRGKNTDTVDANARTEVGSWAIGLWCPERHFEINVWNCFSNRANKFAAALQTTISRSFGPTSDSTANFFKGKTDCVVVNAPYQKALAAAPPGSVDLILTDPPHSDRIPYLELSEFWNSILQYDQVDFNGEIVISNASERKKKPALYASDMVEFMNAASRLLKPTGYLCVLYNCRENGEWDFLRNPSGLRFIGRFDLRYSAGSIVQDNRKGALKTDFALIYSPLQNAKPPEEMNGLSGWSTEFPHSL